MPVRPKKIRPYSDNDIKRSTLLSDDQKKLLLAPPPAPASELPTWKKTLASAVDDLKEWDAVLDPSTYISEPFRTSDGVLMKRASCHPPLSRPGTVTAFTKWVHELYAPLTHPNSVALGRAVDRVLATSRLTPNPSGRWRLLHNGMGDNVEKFYSIPDLAIAGSALKGSPDLVFKESHTGRILIIEVKTTELAIPTGGWPDVRAQLWAYAQIPEFKRAPEILLRAVFYGVNPSLIRRAVIGWTFKASPFDELSDRLFFYYKLRQERFQRNLKKE